MIDSAASYLYLSHATKVVVVDLNKNAVVGEIADTPGVAYTTPDRSTQIGHPTRLSSRMLPPRCSQCTGGLASCV
jgi:hypothetical protein